MKSLYDFIIKPLGDRYENEIKIGDKTLVLNTKIESFKSVNNLAVVVETPKAFKTNIKKGDVILIHHNVFRVFYDMKGVKKNSRSYFKDDLYFCAVDQIYLYKNTEDWKSFGDRCFVMPIKNEDTLKNDKEQKLIGILKYGNKSLESLDINPGDTVGFTPNSEWDFIVDDQRVFCMKSNDIVIKYGHKRNQVEYNPSWAHRDSGTSEGS
jgi:co-chaperonin GroES (HSP10)|tara:strand:+ start:60 stop:686 length:627 start_codon:yes stop_codon:yes gene_type:complete